MKSSKFKKDLYRWYGEKGESLVIKLFRPNEIKYMNWFRKAQAAKNPISQIYARLNLLYLSRKTNIQISWAAKIGEGFYIGHCGRIIINPNAVIGKNVNIAR